MKTKLILLILNIAALLGSLIWLLTSPGWEPLVAVISLIATLVAQLFGGSIKGDKTTMSQKGGKGSTNYQAKGDITVNTKK